MLTSYINKSSDTIFFDIGTIGLFDAVYLNLKKGDNTLLFAISEDFGGWLITGRFEDEEGIIIK